MFSASKIQNVNPKDMEIDYQGVKTTIGELAIEQAQDLIFELLSEKENVNDMSHRPIQYVVWVDAI